MKVAYKGAIAVQMSIFDMLDLDELPVAPNLSQLPTHSERVLQAEPKENFDYTVEHVFIAHQVVLEDALALLTRKGSLRAKIDIIAWIFGPDLIDGKRADTKAFTFQACCISHRVRPDVMQEMIFSQPDVAVRMAELIESEDYRKNLHLLTADAREAVEQGAAVAGFIKKREEMYVEPVEDEDVTVVESATDTSLVAVLELDEQDAD